MSKYDYACMTACALAYLTLHQSLIEACRTSAAEADEAERTFYRHLEDLALPWLTPKALAQVDREILFSLLLCCRRAEQELGRQQLEPHSPDRMCAVR